MNTARATELAESTSEHICVLRAQITAPGGRATRLRALRAGGRWAGARPDGALPTMQSPLWCLGQRGALLPKSGK